MMAFSHYLTVILLQESPATKSQRDTPLRHLQPPEQNQMIRAILMSPRVRVAPHCHGCGVGAVTETAVIYPSGFA